MHDAVFVQWFEALERRHLEKLSFQEVRKAVQALSSLYVERRERIETGTAFASAGKRAALALYFGPLHFLLVREIVRALGATIPGNTAILDLGCGTGPAGAAWALEAESHPRVLGIDRNGWALQECKWNYERLGIRGATRSANIGTLRIPPNTAVIAAFSINELDPEGREQTVREFTRVARNGCPVLIVEPIARRVTSWWDEWAQKLKPLGGRNDDWRFRIDLPERLLLMDKAAGLDHRELTGRSLWLPGGA
jgi:Methyltransferase domain